MTSSHFVQSQSVDNLGSFTGKRSRSSSSSSSPGDSSASGSSIFSRIHLNGSEGSSSSSTSSCSSPRSSKGSPSLAVSSDDERHTKSLRTCLADVAPVQKQLSITRLAGEPADPSLSIVKCTFPISKADSVPRCSPTPSLPPNNLQCANGKTLFVDSLVDATVHVLDMIWHAPVRKSIAFLQNVRSASSICTGEIVRPCRCPVGAPFTGGIPLDLFIRETLRRSRTSCSSLQAALLYCKRVGGEAIRKRAEREQVALTADEAKILDGQPRMYPSLSRSLEKEGDDDSSTIDPILCSRRTFLAAVMTSSKFLQDRTFSNRAWSKISGLSVKELGMVERRMLDAIDFDLYVGDDEWQAWTNYLRGDWKAGIDSCRCQSPSSASSPETPLRKGLERTISLQAENPCDMETQVTRDTGEYARHIADFSDDVGTSVSTPTQTLHDANLQKTPTKSSQHKREQALLPLVLTNNVVRRSEGDAIPAQSNLVYVPAPFPLRKGLGLRSISSQ